jgi:hypothetical protein
MTTAGGSDKETDHESARETDHRARRYSADVAEETSRDDLTAAIGARR